MSNVIRYTGYAAECVEPDGFYIRKPEEGEPPGHWIRAADYDAICTRAAELESVLRRIVSLDGDAYPGLITWHDMRVRADKEARRLLGMAAPRGEGER